jgi:hypothetical protein
MRVSLLLVITAACCERTSSFLCGGTRTPTTVRTFQRRAHHLDVAGAIKRVVNPPFGEIAGNVLLHGHVEFFAIDKIRRTQLLGHFELVRINVHRNDPTGTGQFGPLNDRQALCDKSIRKNIVTRASLFSTTHDRETMTNRTYHRTNAKNRHGRARFYFTRIQNGAKAGRDATTKQAHLFENRLFGYLGARNFSQHGVF